MTQQKPYIITIVGPESSGKTTLARQLAADCGCPWVPEYAREYLVGLGRDYNGTDLLRIAEGQMAGISKQLAVGSEQLAVDRWQSSNGIPNWNPDKNAVLTIYKEDFGPVPRRLIIVDSGMMGMRMWAKIKYNMTIPIVEEALVEDVTSMYILCRPVLPWESDPLREAPRLLDRAWIYNQYLKEIMRLPSK